jgi:hypothetical protein
MHLAQPIDRRLLLYRACTIADYLCRTTLSNGNDFSIHDENAVIVSIGKLLDHDSPVVPNRFLESGAHLIISLEST